MSRYIDADELLNRLPDDLPYKSSVKRVLIQAPTEDVVEVRHGEWIRYGQDYKRCSLCGKVNTNYNNNNFCPNCGAKMNYNFGEDAK